MEKILGGFSRCFQVSTVQTDCVVRVEHMTHNCKGCAKSVEQLVCVRIWGNHCVWVNKGCCGALGKRSIGKGNDVTLAFARITIPPPKNKKTTPKKTKTTLTSQY